MNLFLTAEGAAAGSLIYTLGMVAFMGVIVYFLMIRPQKKEQKRMNAMLSALEIGDCVLTTSGFYGVVIGIEEDTVIVEFGNNKNCRIPMSKTAISQVEKAE